jgi:DedD protein
MAESEDVNSLKRRGRRRLVGAIALVLAAVIVLPMVFDSDPKGSAPPVSVRIPGEDETGFTPKVTPKAPEKPAPKTAEKTKAKAAEKAPEPVAEKAPEKAPEPVAEKIGIKVTKSTDKPVEKPTPIKPAPAPEKPAATAERAKAEAALAGGEQFFVPAGAYLDPAGVIEKLKAAKIPYYTEPIATKDGTVTRVRAGPFGSREAADRALKQLKDLGLKPGNVAARS